MAMLEGSDPHTLDTPPADDSVQGMRDLIERMQAELKFNQTKIEALNFEIARLKRWRFGSSSESLDTTTQAVLFDAILADTALEDRAAEEETKPPSAAPAPKRQAVRQALPACLPRIERHHEIEQTHCACGQAFKRIGEEVSEQLDCCWRRARARPGGPMCGCTARRTSRRSARCCSTSPSAVAARIRAGFCKASAARS